MSANPKPETTWAAAASATTPNTPTQIQAIPRIITVESTHRGAAAALSPGSEVVSKSTRRGAGLDRGSRTTLSVTMAGRRATPSMGDPDRRLAAVWFCDVVGSTEIAEELGDRAFRWLIERFLAVVRSEERRV